MVIMIDDESGVRRTAKSTLERYRCTLSLRKTEKRIDLFACFRKMIRVVLLGMTIPVMSGEETFRKLRAVKPDVRVI